MEPLYISLLHAVLNRGFLLYFWPRCLVFWCVRHSWPEDGSLVCPTQLARGRISGVSNTAGQRTDLWCVLHSWPEDGSLVCPTQLARGRISGVSNTAGQRTDLWCVLHSWPEDGSLVCLTQLARGRLSGVLWPYLSTENIVPALHVPRPKCPDPICP